VSTNLDKIVDELSKLSVIEAASLAKKLEDHWGVSAAVAPVAMQVQSDNQASEAVKDSFNVVISSVGARKIAVIKEVRGITGLGLKESKVLVESEGKPIKEDLSKAEAEDIKAKLEAAGATVELK
jgi:large subunit ribosomal protein L7/L12